MDSHVVLAGLSPHPPIIIPEVGRGEEKGASSTVRAMEKLGKAFASADYDTLVVITPHGTVFGDAVSARGEDKLEGNLGNFDAASVTFTFVNDLELLREISSEGLREADVTTVILDRRAANRYGADKSLDHGVLVPLYYMVKNGFSRSLAVINMGFLPLFDLYRYGMAISKAAARLNRRIAVLASGDLSHRLQVGAPAGYNPNGSRFDEKLVGHLRDFEPQSVVSFPSDLAEEAGECGLRPVTIMLGTLDGVNVKSELLSYEGPFGVGYGVALFRPQGESGSSRLSEIAKGRRRKIAEARANESFPVKLARTTVEAYVHERKVPEPPKDVPPEFKLPAGVFVSIHKEGMLRGCIGTTGPTCDSAAKEIVQNAVSASTSDPRFDAISLEELELLDYSVDILSEPEPIPGEDSLDPKIYGVIVDKGGRRGLLLPDLPGVDTVREQVEIAKRKAGIRPSEAGVRLSRFTVTRYH